MFKCGVCKKSSERGEKAVAVVLERREVEHPSVYHRRREKTMPGGRGTQIVRQILAHGVCANAQPPPVLVTTPVPIGVQWVQGLQEANDG